MLQSGPESNGYEGLLHIPQISKAGTSPSDVLVIRTIVSGVGSYPSTEMHSVYSPSQTDWDEI